MKFILNDLELRAIMGLSKDELRTLESEGLAPAIRTNRGWICSWEGLHERTRIIITQRIFKIH